MYRKSAKGAEAIAARLHGVAGRSRALLILVDGKRTYNDLLALATGFGDVNQMLDDLERGGFIEPVPGAAPLPNPATGARPVPSAPPTAGAQPAAAATKAGSTTLAQAKANACHKLIEALGPTADSLCLKIESTGNRADFIAAIERAYSVVREVRGKAEADAFGALVEANLPAI